MDRIPITISTFENPNDFDTQCQLVQLYEGIFPITPVLHQALTGVAGMTFHVARLRGSTTIVGAGLLKTAEAVMPLCENMPPIAYGISDMVTLGAYRRAGVATEMLRALEQTAVKRGGSVLYLCTGTANLPAIALYEKAGFSRRRDSNRQAVFVKLVGSPYGAHGR